MGPKSVKTCPAGMKKALKPGFGAVHSFPTRSGYKGPRRSFGRGKRRRKGLANEDESALPPSAMRQRCGPIYVCVPDTPIDGPQPCPKSVKTCPAGMKKVLKPGFGAVHIHADIVRGGRPRRSFGGGKRRRKVLANEDESALPEWAMRRRCGPVYICVPDKQNDSCPKSVM